MSDDTTIQESTDVNSKYLNPMLFYSGGVSAGSYNAVNQISYILSFLMGLQCGNSDCNIDLHGEAGEGFNYLMMFIRETLQQCGEMILDEEKEQRDKIAELQNGIVTAKKG